MKRAIPSSDDDDTDNSSEQSSSDSDDGVAKTNSGDKPKAAKSSKLKSSKGNSALALRLSFIVFHLLGQGVTPPIR